MEIGGIEFENVMAFQLKCMMANQYSTLVQAFNNKNSSMVLVACLRLGWNDAFRHTSKNVDSVNTLPTPQKEELIMNVCNDILDEFTKYAKMSNMSQRIIYLNERIDNNFLDKFKSVKIVSDKERPLCFGHLQKMFNIAIKLLVCLKITAEHLDKCGIQVKLGEINQASVYFNKEIIDDAIKNFCLDTADCPVDSIILNKIGIKNVTWSQIGKDNNHSIQGYIDAQNQIKTLLNNNKKSNLCYDFENWNL